MFCPTLRRYLCACAALLLLQVSARAVILDWDTVAWADGTLNNSYLADVNDPSSGITINVAPNNGAPIVPYSVPPNPTTPTITNGFQGGLLQAENTLAIAVNLTDPSQSVTVTISFAASGGAMNVSFKLFDIDAGGGAQDQLSLIRALSIDGSTLIAPTITSSQDNTLIGSGLTQSVVGTGNTPSTGLTSGRGNVTIDFGSSLIQSLTFTFGSTNAFADPNYQHFAIHDISFTPVPEISPGITSIFSCLAAAGLVLRHRAKLRK